MASPNTSPSSKNSEIHDSPIIPPQPIVRKEYKEVVPDISVISDIVDNGSQLQNFQKTHLGHQTGSKYFQILSKTDTIPESNLLLATPDNLHKSIDHTSYQQQLEIGPFVSKAVKDINERNNLILDHNTILPFKIYYNPACPSCVTNCTVMTSKENIGIQYVLPKNCASALVAVGNEQFNKEMRCKFNDEVISNKTLCKHMDSNATASSSHKSVTCNHTHLSGTSNSKEPEMPQVMDIPNSCCSKDQHYKLRKSLSKSEKHASSDSLSEDSRKSEETCEKETGDRNLLKNRNILCPTCWKKTTCACNFSAKKCTTNSSKKSDESVQLTEKFSGNANLHTSDELSSIWEYLKQQDEKINLINKKVSSFLSQHEACYIGQPTERNDVSKETESDIPYILNILEVHSDKIRELQDQINSLKSNKQISSPANNNKVDESILNRAQTINCADIGTCNEEIHFPCSHNAICHEQKQKVTKTSTSTMTSFAIENNDKLVYHKQLTVVTDVTREKKESSSLPKEHYSPTTKSHLDVKNVNSNSHKRKSHKIKCSPRLKCKTNRSSNSSSDAPDLNDNQALKTSHKSEKTSKRASTGNKVIDEPEDQPYPSELKRNMRHVNDWTMKDNNTKERKNSPTLKTAATKSHSRSSKQKMKNNASPKIVDNATLRDLEKKKNMHQTSTSSSSTDTEYDSPTQRQKQFDIIELDSEQESTTKSKYGLSSKYLSIATKKYLDKFQLHLDKNNRTESS